MALPSWSAALKFFHLAQRSRPSFYYLCSNGGPKECFVQRPSIVVWSSYSSDAKDQTRDMDDGSDVKPKKKKVFVPRVTLLSEENEISVVTMDMATRIASRRNLKLVKIVDFDMKTERPTYKLMSTKDYIQEGMQRKKTKKIDKETALRPEKMLSMSSKIAEHDLATKLKSVAKLLAKKHEIRIVISIDGNKDKATSVAQEIEKSVKELSVRMDTKTSGNTIKIYLRPVINVDKTTEPPLAAAS